MRWIEVVHSKDNQSHTVFQNGDNFRLFLRGEATKLDTVWPEDAPESHRRYRPFECRAGGLLRRYKYVTLIAAHAHKIIINQNNVFSVFRHIQGQNMAPEDACQLAIVAAINYHKRNKRDNSTVSLDASWAFICGRFPPVEANSATSHKSGPSLCADKAISCAVRAQTQWKMKRIAAGLRSGDMMLAVLHLSPLSMPSCRPNYIHSYIAVHTTFSFINLCLQICLMGKYHNVLYVALKVAWDWGVKDNGTITLLLGIYCSRHNYIPL